MQLSDRKYPVFFIEKIIPEDILNLKKLTGFCRHIFIYIDITLTVSLMFVFVIYIINKNILIYYTYEKISVHINTVYSLLICTVR